MPEHPIFTSTQASLKGTKAASSDLPERLAQSGENEALLDEWHEKLSSPPRGKKGILTALSLLLLTLVLITPFLIPWSKYTTAVSIANIEATGDQAVSSLGYKVSDQQRKLLIGDASVSAPSDRWLALHEQDPTNPTYFFPYVTDQIDGEHDLPPEISAFIDTYDPNNGAYDLLQLPRERSFAKRLTSPARKDRFQLATSPRAWEVIDEERLKEAVELLKRAYRKGVINSYNQQIMQERSDILGAPTNEEDYIIYTAIKLSPSNHLSSAYLRAASIINIAVTEASKQEDWEELKELWAISSWLIDQQIEENASLLDSIVSIGYISSNSVAFYAAVHSCPDQSFKDLVYQKYEKVRLYTELMRKSNEDRGRAFEEEYGQYFGIFAWLSNLTSRLTQNPVMNKEALLRALDIERILLSKILWNPLLVMTIIYTLFSAFIRWGTSRLDTRILSWKLYQATATKQVVFISLACFVIPLLLFLGYHHLWGAQSYEHTYLNPQNGLHVIGLFIFLAFFSVSLCQLGSRWLVARASLRWFSFLPLISCVLGLLVIPFTATSAYQTLWQWIAYGLFTVVALAFLAPLYRLFLRKTDRKLTQSLISISILPMLAMTSLNLVLILKLLSNEGRNTVTALQEIHPHTHPANYSEYTINQQYLKQVKALHH